MDRHGAEILARRGADFLWMNVRQRHGAERWDMDDGEPKG